MRGGPVRNGASETAMRAAAQKSAYTFSHPSERTTISVYFLAPIERRTTISVYFLAPIIERRTT
jgi:hypothetical protein